VLKIDRPLHVLSKVLQSFYLHNEAPLH
jgi:hypothetical protein